MEEMIITSVCEKCAHSQINETNKANIRVYCEVKDKTFCWGQCIPCDTFTKVKGK